MYLGVYVWQTSPIFAVFSPDAWWASPSIEISITLNNIYRTVNPRRPSTIAREVVRCENVPCSQASQTAGPPGRKSDSRRRTARKTLLVLRSDPWGVTMGIMDYVDAVFSRKSSVLRVLVLLRLVESNR